MSDFIEATLPPISNGTCVIKSTSSSGYVHVDVTWSVNWPNISLPGTVYFTTTYNDAQLDVDGQDGIVDDAIIDVGSQYGKIDTCRIQLDNGYVLNCSKYS